MAELKRQTKPNNKPVGFPVSENDEVDLGGFPASNTNQEHFGIQILPHFDAAAATTAEPVAQAAPPPPQQQDLELPKLVAAFCLTAALQSVQTRNHYPITFQLLRLLMVLALAFLVVAKYVVANYPKPGRFLEHAGVLCGVTAFFGAITVSFPLCLKLISWMGLEISKEA
ncbi:hypothetical protein LOK49_LG14G00361 [Camellia lanceoleosa]|uniref:Uncharacterized protein n=1 Tax=Camellia lanceoleosa TaxID=1840588 RepID=A0ACC0FAR8_9ERIC|nr:hypothetical protein LOK49_LG14G00361 [Camellia lanceoleosa]